MADTPSPSAILPYDRQPRSTSSYIEQIATVSEQSARQHRANSHRVRARQDCQSSLIAADAEAFFPASLRSMSP